MRKILLMTLLGALATSAFAGSQKAIDVQSVQGLLVRKHATWQAGENWLTRLSTSEITRMLGLQKPPQGSLDFESAAIQATGGVDWRNVNGANWLGQMMNQGNCGSCVAFATVATLEARTAIAWGAPWLRPSFSAQALFACGGGGCAYGWRPDDAADFLINKGVPDEACMPYTSGSTGEDMACSQKCSDADARSMKIAGATMPSSYGGSVEAVKAALKRGPLETTLTVYEDFVTYSSGIYKHVTGAWMGGHAVSLVGYDDAKRAWLIRNSWGPEWGEGGYGWISWDDTSGIGADTWEFDVRPSQGYIGVTAPTDREYASGKYRMVAQGQAAKAQDIRFRIRDNDGREVVTVACAVAAGEGCATELDTTQLKQGRYEVFAEGVSEPSLKSQVREFFVINSDPQMNISLKPAPGVDLSKPLKGRPEFIIKATFSPVPIQNIEFRVLDQSGKLVSRKSNDYIVPEMKMGWRTVGLAPGRYTIMIHGETRYNGKTYAVDSNSYQVTVKN